jgi:hypothetical protein
MVDRGRVQDVNEAAARFAETLADSYRVVYGQATESAERQQQRAQEFSELVSSNLRQQSEAGRANAQQLSEEAARQQEAGQALARESVEAYTQFLNDAFSRYWGGHRAGRSERPGGRAHPLRDDHRIVGHRDRGGRRHRPGRRAGCGGGRIPHRGLRRYERG